jgi:hypothetical protein
VFIVCRANARTTSIHEANARRQWLAFFFVFAFSVEMFPYKHDTGSLPDITLEFLAAILCLARDRSE